MKGQKLQGDGLRIAVIVKSFNLYGGMERYAVEVARRLSLKGHKVDIFAREADKNLLGKMDFFPLTKSFSFSSVLGAAALAADVSRKISGKKYDIVHSHERSYCQDVLTFHCFSYKGSLENYGFFRKLDQTYLSPRSWLYLWLEKKQLLTENIVSVSDVVLNDIRRNYDLKGKEFTISPGVDTDYFTPAWLKENRKKVRKELDLENEKIILFVGSEFKRKGLDFVFSALPKGVILLVVGSGEYLEVFRKKAKKQGVDKSVVFAGHSEDVRNYYAAADLVVLPSRSEAFGMSILEGMSCGLPVVTTANTGVSSIIENGKNGFVVEKGEDLKQFFSAFFKKDCEPEIGTEARKTAMKFQWDIIADQYEELFYKIVDHKKAAALKP